MPLSVYIQRWTKMFTKKQIIGRVVLVLIAVSVIWTLWLTKDYQATNKRKLLLSNSSKLKPGSPGFQAFQDQTTQVPPVLRKPGMIRPVLVSGVWHLPWSQSQKATSMPKILHQTFKSEMVYESYIGLISNCLKLNPDWTYFLWRDAEAEALIAKSYPQFLARYRAYTDNLERADSIRYIVLHHFGGVYIDMDVDCRQPFFPALSQLPAFLDQERTEQTNIYWSEPYFTMNSAMGSVPGHPFFFSMVEAMMKHRNIGNALDSTGPRLLTQRFREYSDRVDLAPVVLMEPRVFSPMMDTGKNWKAFCQHPGNQIVKDGCRTLSDKKWRMDDTDNATLGIHLFLHLGYGSAAHSRRQSRNLTLIFPGRVKFYAGSNAG